MGTATVKQPGGRARHYLCPVNLPRSKEVNLISDITLLMAVIGIFGLMIGFATLVLKIVEVARHK